MEAAFIALVGSLIELLEPQYAEVVWRAEILNQEAHEIAYEMKLSEQTVALRLRAGRRALFHLAMLVLSPSAAA